MRRSSSAALSGIPRRSSSVDGSSNWGNGFGAVGSNSQQQSQQQQSFGALNSQQSNLNRQSTGRMSMIGRPSMCTKPGEAKPINTTELAQAINQALLNLDYKQPINVKALLLPSTGTFYSIFEFFLKTIGIPDPWNPNLLAPPAPQKNASGQTINSSSQPQQQNAVTQNKQRLELIIHHLTVLRYNNIPKPNVLQTMTTPKNWAHMLQILQFLANDCTFLEIYDSRKLLYTFDKNREIMNEYMKKAYAMVMQNSAVMETEEYIKMKEESLRKFENHIRGNLNLKDLESERDELIKQYDYYNKSKNELDTLHNEEQELIRQVNEAERTLNDQTIQYEDACKRVKIDRKDMHVAKEKLELFEKEMDLKEIEYDKQLSSGQQLDNLPMKHAQKVQELEQLQNTFVELETKTDELHMKLMQKAQDVKETIASANELVNKVKLCSTLTLGEFPQLDLLDFHKKHDLIKEFKEHILKIRESYNQQMCMLPEMFSQCREEKKMLESKLNTNRIKMNNFQTDNIKLENHNKNIRIQCEETLNALKQNLNEATKRNLDGQNQLQMLNEEIAGIKLEMENIVKELKKVEADIPLQLKDSEQSYQATSQRVLSELEEKQKKYVSDCKKDVALLNDLNKQAKLYLDQF